MSLLKKVSVLAVIMIALIIPAVAISGNAVGDVEITGDAKAGGFNDRTAGTVTVRLYNTSIDLATGDITVSVVRFDEPGAVYAEKIVSFTGEETEGFMDVSLSFRLDSPGTYYARVIIEGDSADPIKYSVPVTIEVGRSIWSSTWTYVAIVLVIIIVAIAVFIKMRGAPKVEDKGTFTAMEEERKAGKGQRSGRTEKEEYKGRKKKN